MFLVVFGSVLGTQSESPALLELDPHFSPPQYFLHNLPPTESSHSPVTPVSLFTDPRPRVNRKLSISINKGSGVGRGGERGRN